MVNNQKEVEKAVIRSIHLAALCEGIGGSLSIALGFFTLNIQFFPFFLLMIFSGTVSIVGAIFTLTASLKRGGWISILGGVFSSFTIIGIIPAILCFIGGILSIRLGSNE